MNLIVETDIGHDPDDFFSICYLIGPWACRPSAIKDSRRSQPR